MARYPIPAEGHRRSQRHLVGENNLVAPQEAYMPVEGTALAIGVEAFDEGHFESFACLAETTSCRPQNGQCFQPLSFRIATPNRPQLVSLNIVETRLLGQIFGIQMHFVAISIHRRKEEALGRLLVKQLLDVVERGL